MIVSCFLLLLNGSLFVSEKYLDPFGLRLDEFFGDKTGRGVQTLTDRSPGDVLMEIPNNCVITSQRLFERYPFLASDKTEAALSDEEVLAAGICFLKATQDDYISSFPESHASIITLPSQVWDDIASCLPGCYRTSLQATRDWTSEACHKIRSCLQEQSTISISDEDDLIRWACSMVRSRSIAVPELGTNEDDDSSSPLQEPPRGLFPGLDLLNHRIGAGTQLALDTEDDVWRVTTQDKYSKNDQIFLSYGDDKDNWKLLLTYGFCLEHNPSALIFFDIDDLLNAAMKSPRLGKVITARVKESLKQNPQLRAYTSLGEDRATFSYDAKLQEPRESLHGGLALMTSVANQLGSIEESSVLATELFQMMIEIRRKELQTAVSDIPKVKAKVGDEWNGFVSSLELVLKQELGCLTRS